MSTPKKTLLLLVVIAAAFGLSAYYSSPGEPETTSFTIEQGESVESVVTRLADAGFVRSRTLFKWAVTKSGLATRIQPGEHDLAGVKTYGDIIGRIASGGVAADEVTLLVREGESLRQIDASLEGLGAAAAGGLYAVTGAPAEYPARVSAGTQALEEEYSFLAGRPDGAGLEGYLFPDTYRIYRDASAEDVVRKMLDNFGERMTAGLLADVKATGRTFHEIVTMASILEREVRGAEDQRLVSDIFWRRLDEGMRLQSCATVNYVTGGDSPAVSYEDTQIDSPYNTYRYAGLPPGPIGNPGLGALEAAADPEPNGFWYFLTDTEGNVHYARTLDEHNWNKATYLK